MISGVEHHCSFSFDGKEKKEKISLLSSLHNCLFIAFTKIRIWLRWMDATTSHFELISMFLLLRAEFDILINVSESKRESSDWRRIVKLIISSQQTSDESFTFCTAQVTNEEDEHFVQQLQMNCVSSAWTTREKLRSRHSRMTISDSTRRERNEKKTWNWSQSLASFA